MQASSHGDEDTVKQLLHRGADVDIQDIVIIMHYTYTIIESHLRV